MTLALRPLAAICSILMLSGKLVACTHCVFIPRPLPSCPPASGVGNVARAVQPAARQNDPAEAPAKSKSPPEQLPAPIERSSGPAERVSSPALATDSLDGPNTSYVKTANAAWTDFYGCSKPPNRPGAADDLLNQLRDALGKEAVSDAAKKEGCRQLATEYQSLADYVASGTAKSLGGILKTRDNTLSLKKFTSGQSLKLTTAAIEHYLDDQLPGVGRDAVLTGDQSAKVATALKAIADALSRLP